ncbi:50S ribosomal protein L25/general stress protein Ctc [Mesobacillus zeae]|uniref:Large ribosomal subunit protein bL25 n=1 Tax=Mesobacillus zeae TaxID=1917180 RepID=A0A398BEJ4_9BACI|nr:50S ribosomal protein L25/general stress protein Ctc [Mesobacillus zeae]RID88645.1 50S ribosomal protein L25/general stress protein Ctc [Mesobacillus zeae]
MSSVLNAKERTDLRTSSLRKLRNEGNIPAVVYGNSVDSRPVYVSGADFQKIIREVGRNGVISLNVGGSSQNVILSSYQEDAIKREILHADFLAVDMSTEVSANVRINLTGKAAGVKDGGVMQQPVHELSITATPNNIPPSLDVDISSLQVGENLTVADIKKGTLDFQIQDDEETVIVSILPPKQEEEINSGEQQEPGIPENEEGRETKASEK